MAESTAPRRPLWPVPALLAAFCAVYLLLGAVTEAGLLAKKPLADYVLQDFTYYARAWGRAAEGADPYDQRAIANGFLYPPPALLVVAPFARLGAPALRAAVYTAVNVALLVTMLLGVARLYDLPWRRVWWWLPVGLGFAPFLETLHIGQINVLTMFAVFLAFAWQRTRPLAAGAALSLAVVTKLSPLAYAGYWLVTRNARALLGTLLGLLALTAVAAALYGAAPFVTYADVFAGLLDELPTGRNAQSLAAVLDARGWLSPAALLGAQRALAIYVVALLVLSGALTYLLREREPLFIVVGLATAVAPNVMWYHHYVFLLLPLFVWLAWRRLAPGVTAWVLLGLALIQVDRVHGLLPASSGLLAHAFVHLTLWLVVAGQARRLAATLRAGRDVRGLLRWSPARG